MLVLMTKIYREAIEMNNEFIQMGKNTVDSEKQLKKSLRKLLQMHDERYQCVITVERSYKASDK